MAEITMKGVGDFILAAIVIAFLAAAGIIALTSVQESDVLGTSTAVGEENVTISADNRLSPAFSAFPYQFDGVTSITNTSGYTLATKDYNVTIEKSGGGSYIQVTPLHNGSTWNVSYTYTAFDKPMNITRDGNMGINNTLSFFGVIGTLIAVALLIGIVALFARRKI